MAATRYLVSVIVTIFIFVALFSQPRLDTLTHTGPACTEPVAADHQFHGGNSSANASLAEPAAPERPNTYGYGVR